MPEDIHERVARDIGTVDWWRRTSGNARKDITEILRREYGAIESERDDAIRAAAHYFNPDPESSGCRFCLQCKRYLTAPWHFQVCKKCGKNYVVKCECEKEGEAKRG